MQTIASALAALDDETKDRVLKWAADRYRSTRTGTGVGLRTDPASSGDPSRVTAGSLAELYSAVNPQDGPERALVATYWLQQIGGAQDVTAQAVNSELKNLGHGIGNITDALDALRSRTPSLVMQTRKQGTSRQARKLYRLTVAGIRAVEEMIGRATL